MTSKNIYQTSVEPEKSTKFWLLVIGASLVAVHSYLISKYGNTSLISISVIFLTAVLFILWEKRNKLQLNSHIFYKFLGSVFIACVLFKSISISEFEPFVQFSPFLSALGIGIFASGLKGLKQYSQEFILLLTIAIPFEDLVSHFFDLATLSANCAASILSCFGFGASSQGSYVILPTGTIKVSHSCSGLKVVARLLRLTILFLVMFPSNWLQRILVPVVAVFIAFIGNAVRIAVLAILVAYSKHNLFEFFHGQGARLFTMTPIIIFTLLCYFIVQHNKSKNQEARSGACSLPRH